jgi:hypothetical protein
MGVLPALTKPSVRPWYFRAPESVLKQLPAAGQRHHQLQLQAISIAGQHH